MWYMGNTHRYKSFNGGVATPDPPGPKLVTTLTRQPVFLSTSCMALTSLLLSSGNFANTLP